MKQIFVSSTFRDMHIERDLIQTKLTPDLNEKAYEKRIEGVKFQDLRWGIDANINEEEDTDREILKVCLDEIDNNRPYFFVLLGDRYGWIPENDLVKETGIRYGIYQADEKIEKSITHLEIDYGFLKNPQYAETSYAYFRNIIGDVKGTVYEQDPAEKAKVEALKDEIRATLPASNIHEYNVIIKDGNLTGVDKFVALAKEDMKKILFKEENQKSFLSENQKEINYHKSQAREQAAVSSARKVLEGNILAAINQRNVIAIKGKSGSGKTTLMANLEDKLSRQKESIILFSSMTPKSASSSGIMKIISEYIKESLAKEGKVVEDLGTTKEISLSSKGGTSKNTPAKNKLSLITEEDIYEKTLRQYLIYGQKEIVILIDGIDQLDKPSAIVSLIKPLNLIKDSKVKFIISYLDDGIDNDTYLFLNDFLNYTLVELSEKDKLQVINYSLKANNKKLPFSIKKEIIVKEGAKSPLYINLLVQRLSMMNRDDYINIIGSGDGYEKIRTYQEKLVKKIPNDIKELIIDLITHASHSLKTNTDDVKTTITYLALSRHGLRESDLKKIYDLKGRTYNSLDFASLKKYLRAFFLEDKHLRIDFTHKIIRQAIIESLTEKEVMDYCNDIANAFMYLPVEDDIKLEDQYYFAYKSKNKESAIEYLLSIGSNYEKLEPSVIQAAVDEIIKIHNSRVDFLNDDWIIEIYLEFAKIDLSMQKVLLASFVYTAYNDGTRESISAIKHNRYNLLVYLKKLLEIYPEDTDLMRFYADELTFIGMKYSLHDKKNFEISEQYLAEAIKINENLLGIDMSFVNRESLANIYSNIGKLYIDFGYILDAKFYYEKSIDLFKSLVDDDKTLVSYENLAMVYNNVGNLYYEGDLDDLTDAKRYYSQSIDIINKLLKDYPNISLKKTMTMGYINMASIYVREEDYNKAQYWYYKAIEQIIEIERIAPNLENKEVLGKAYNNLADLFSSELFNDRQKASDFYFKAKGIFETILKSKELISVKQKLALTNDNIGNLYSDWKDLEAEPFYKKSIEIREELLKYGRNRDLIIDLATTYNNLAFLYQDNKTSYDYAMNCYKKSANLLCSIDNYQDDKKCLDSLAICYTNASSLYCFMGDVKRAEDFARKAIGIYTKQIDKYRNDDDIEKLIIIYNNLACHMTDMDYPMGMIEDLYIKAIDKIKIMNDPYRKRKKMAITYNNLANLYLIKDKNFKLAEACYLEGLKQTKSVVAEFISLENLERLMVTYYNLSRLYDLWDKGDKSKHYMRIAKKIHKKIDYTNNRENINKFIYRHLADN